MEYLLSPEALQSIASISSFGRWTYCFEFQIESTNKVKHITKHKHIWIGFVQPIFVYLRFSLFILWACWSWIADPERQPSAIILIIIHFGMYLIAATNQRHFFQQDHLCLVMSETLQMAQNIYTLKAGELKTSTRSINIRKYAIAIFIIFIQLIAVLYVPAFSFAMEFNLPMYKYFKIYNPFVYHPLMAGFVVYHLCDWTMSTVVSYFFLTQTYTSSVILRLASQQWFATTKCWKKDTFHKLYTWLRIEHTVMAQLLEPCLPFYLLANTILLIAPLLYIIKHHNLFNPMLCILAGIIAIANLIVIGGGFVLAGILHTESQTFINLFRYYFAGSKIDRLRSKSYKPIIFKVGIFYGVGKLTYPLHIHELVIPWLITFLFI